MIDIKNLVKVYRTKKGVKVTALNEVSLQLPNKGMIFILGKSGCGKSTLLNIIGGLDKFDGGTVEVKGKSFGGFKQQDYDSYRNSCVGFIFQEYNLLDDFTLKQNIALALELQNKKGDDETIDNVLKSVGLEGYGVRKLNELSGGQKQRVAIARAIVKNPDIILADEPSGALDSETGAQVFECLKVLSKEKLVVVVSHDREFAETYGDRIVELADGKIISDSVSVESGEIKSFKETKVEDIVIKTYNMDEGGTKKSKLPAGKAIKLGFGGLKAKAYKLILSVLLCAISFSALGIASSLSGYDRYAVHKKSLLNSGDNYISISNAKFPGTSLNDRNINMIKETACDEFIKAHPTFQFKKVISPAKKIGSILDVANSGIGYSSHYYSTNVAGIFESDRGYVESLGFNIIGDYPKNVNEIAITKHLFDYYVAGGWRDKEGNVVEVKSIDDMYGNEINIGGKYFKLVGVVDTKFDPTDRYKPLREYEGSSMGTANVKLFNLVSMKSVDTTQGPHSLIYAMDGFTNTNYESDPNRYTSSGADYDIRIVEKKDSQGGMALRSVDGFYDIKNYSGDEIQYIKGKTVADMNENAVIVNINDYLTDNEKANIRRQIQTEMETFTLRRLNNLDDAFYTFCENMHMPKSYNEQSFNLFFGYISSGLKSETVESDMLDYVEKYNILAKEKYGAEIASITDDRVVYLSNFFENKLGATITYNIIGYTIDDKFYIMSKDGIGRLNVDLQTYEPTPVLLLGIMDKSKIDDILAVADRITVGEKYLDYEKDINKLMLTNSASAQAEWVSRVMSDIETILLIIAIVCAIFAIIMFSNFIATSISYKRKEIGILKALGASGRDVFAIFAAESCILAMINWLTACLFCGIATICMNIAFKGLFALSISIITFLPISALIMFALSFGIALISCAIPIIKISKQKPIDAIAKR